MDSLRKMLNDEENDEESHILGGDVRYPFILQDTPITPLPRPTISILICIVIYVYIFCWTDLCDFMVHFYIVESRPNYFKCITTTISSIKTTSRNSVVLVKRPTSLSVNCGLEPWPGQTKNLFVKLVSVTAPLGVWQFGIAWIGNIVVLIR